MDSDEKTELIKNINDENKDDKNKDDENIINYEENNKQDNKNGEDHKNGEHNKTREYDKTGEDNENLEEKIIVNNDETKQKNSYTLISKFYKDFYKINERYPIESELINKFPEIDIVEMNNTILQLKNVQSPSP